mgnify:CR=1 FL=1
MSVTISTHLLVLFYDERDHFHRIMRTNIINYDLFKELEIFKHNYEQQLIQNLYQIPMFYKRMKGIDC